MRIVRRLSCRAAGEHRVRVLPYALICTTLVLHLGVTAAAAQTARNDGTTQAVLPADLVFSASRYAQDTRDAPASVTIITAKEIRDYGYRTLADLLGAVRGFSTRNDLNYEYASVRGLARLGDFNTRLLVMLDGQRLNGGIGDVSYIGTDALVDLDRVARVEIVRGPGSALFGTNAFSGVVNIVTDRRVGADGGARVEAEVGSFGTARASAAWSTRPGATREAMIGASGQRRRGVDRFDAAFDSPNENNGIATMLDGDESARLISRVRSGAWTLQGAVAHRTREVPTAPYATVYNGSPTQTTDMHAAGALAYNRAFDDLSRLNINLGVVRARYDGQYRYEQSVISDYDMGNQWTLEAQYLRVIGVGHKVAVGGEGRLMRDGGLGATETGDSASSTHITSSLTQNVGALYAQAEWRLGDHALLYTGVRHDEYQAVGGTTNPRVALVVRPAEHTAIKALYGAAFRAPSFYERFYEDDGASQKPPASLHPETVRTFEVELEQRVGTITSSLSAYTLTTNALINLTLDPSDSLLVFQNEGAPISRGVELELRGSIGRVTGRGSVSWQHGQDEQRVRLADSPRRLARLGISVPLTGERSNLAVELRHVGERRTLDGRSANAYTLTHATWLLRWPAYRAELLVSVKNVFNQAYSDPAGPEHRQHVIVQDGRSLRTGLRVTF